MFPRPTHHRPGLLTTFFAGLAVALLLLNTGCSSDPDHLPIGRAAAVDSYVKAVLVYKSGDTDKAIAALKDAIAQHQDLTMAHSMLGDLYQSKRNFVALGPITLVC